MKRVMADNSATVHKMLSTSLQPAIAKALKTQATVGGSLFGPFISVARGHLRE